MARTDTLPHFLTDVADSIRTKAGTSDLIQASQFDTAIANIPSGGGEIPEHGVFFIDYDGSIVKAWESSSVASKTSLPDYPTHTELTAQGWNWSLSDIKDYIEDYPEVNVYVGQMYATASGLTEFDIVLTKVTGLTVTCNMVGSKNWGDGAINTSTSHTYNDYGKYTITCDGASINGNIFSDSSSLVETRISNSVTSISSSAFYNCYSLTNITIPSSVTSISSSAFSNCYSLTSITIPSRVTSISSSFSNCYSLTNITIPSSVTSISSSAFRNCYSLTSITIPSGVTSVENGLCENCYVLSNVNILGNVTSVGNYVFRKCYAIIKYDFTSVTAVPTLSNINAFDNINHLCKIIVPDELYNDWIIATNWSTYANYIYKASEV